jgi:hypothetical protein
MKRLILFKYILCILLFAIIVSANAQYPAADPSSIIGKVVCGYQGWFTATGDGSPINRWTHWAPTTAPQPGILPNPNPNLTFDVYPDVSIYDPTALFQTNFASQGDGTPAKLFSSYKDTVVNKHFSMMQENRIDGVAFQRFIWEVLVDPAFKANRDSSAIHVMKAAEKYQRMFYLVYDLSGLGNVPAADDSIKFNAIKSDFKNTMQSTLHFTASPMYTKQGGKPVVQIWGIGYNHIIGSAAIQLDLINWFKAQGCYVIEGVPTGWRTGTGASLTGWINTYKAADMISPWSVGAYSDSTSTNTFQTSFLTPDLTYCNTNSIAYQPVIFPGFSWSNWNGGAQNQISRNKGDFLWHQAMNLQSMGISTAEIAMFDEYDEGTAICNIADGFNQIPTNQYFVTSCADGTYISSDFYLRLAGKLTRVMKGLDATNPTVNIPYASKPIYFRTSFEPKYDAIAVVSNNALSNVATYNLTTGNPACVSSTAMPHKGLTGLSITGNDRSATTSYAYFNTFGVNIPVTANMELSFYTYPVNALGRYVSVDLKFSDNTYLRDAGALDTAGNNMHPSTGRGTVGTWSKIKCKIGTWVPGKTITQILVGYDNAQSTGNFSTYIDDISINEAAFIILPVKMISFSAKAISNYDALLQWKVAEETGLKEYELQRSIDGVSFERFTSVTPSAGNGQKDYNVTDAGVAGLFSNINRFYYRIKSLDQDDKASYSSIQSVSFVKKATLITGTFPNPFTDKINISINALAAGDVDILVTDAAGHELVRKTVTVQKGATNIPLKGLQALFKNVYFLKLTFNGETSTIKIEK